MDTQEAGDVDANVGAQRCLKSPASHEPFSDRQKTDGVLKDLSDPVGTVR